MVIRTRARSDSAKEKRREHLLGVARELFSERGMGFSMLEVAQSARLAKGTTYLYFATKEEMLLEIFREELNAWFTELHQILEQPQHLTLEQPQHLALEQPQHLALEQPQHLASQIAKSISSRELLVALFAVQVSILEQNLSYEAALKFKTFLLEQSLAVIPKLEQAIANSNGLEVLQTLNALVIGLAQMSRPVGAIKEVLQRPEIAVMHVSFAIALEQSLITLFKGLETKGDL